MNFKHETINLLIREFSYKSYLEIGLGPLQETWKFINCDHKECVDINKGSADLPTFLGTSDDFFKQNSRQFDLIYIDGDHSSDQVRKDLRNSLDILSPGGIIVMHDIAPEKREHTSPRSSGDAFKVFIESRRNPHLACSTYFYQSGDAIGIIWRGKNQKLFTKEIYGDDFDFYLTYKEEILNPISIEEIISNKKDHARE
jgi:hypothetical protein